MLALVNEANKTKYTTEHVFLRNVRPYSDNYSGANTSVTLIGVDPRYYRNVAEVFYRRLDIGHTIEEPPASFEITESTTMNDVIGMVQNRLMLVPSEVIFKDFRTSTEESVSYITLQARPESCLYTGSIDIPLVWTGSADGDLISLLEPGRLLHQLIHVIMPADGYF